MGLVTARTILLSLWFERRFRITYLSVCVGQFKGFTFVLDLQYIVFHTSLSTQHIWPSGFLGCQSDGLELVTWRTQRSSVWFWQF